MSEIMQKIVELGVTYGGKLLLAIVTLIIGLFIIKTVKRSMEKAQKNAKLDKTLQVVIKNIVTTLLYIVLFISIVEILGVPMTSVMTLIASCGLAIGLSLQGALANFAGGLMILLFKPFKVGDYIEAGGAEGVVKDINIFYTVLVTLDNIRISIPNGDLMNSNISNFNGEDIRRIDLEFKITNDCDQDTAQQVLLKAGSETKGVLQDPAPFARLSAVDDDTWIFTVRVWCDSRDYWDVYFDALENCSKALGDNGIDDPEERIAVRIVNND